MTEEIIVSVEKFEAMEKVLTDSGVINHDEWFCRGGARFIARGQHVTINPKAFNGASWTVEIVMRPLVSPQMN